METMELIIGGLSKKETLVQLYDKKIKMNPLAETYINDTRFKVTETPRKIQIIMLSVAELGLTKGANLSTIYKQAAEKGLLLCPEDTGIYLRMGNRYEKNSHGLVSKGKAPDDSLTVATKNITSDIHFPKGLYLRKIEGDLWLRGYICDDEHLFSSEDRFVFCKK
ncbi:helicase [Vagococcus hydrophili]|uniref:Helicase n=1 Tax=Vagococcus hydrophili TaxID=2714947 RepID=A0A6G8AT73_9ENTE|nr:helicase [Vagococcus hydrophili]QIL48135.1 helicase [Vagococcus hydrophili]